MFMTSPGYGSPPPRLQPLERDDSLGQLRTLDPERRQRAREAVAARRRRATRGRRSFLPLAPRLGRRAIGVEVVGAVAVAARFRRRRRLAPLRALRAQDVVVSASALLAGMDLLAHRSLLLRRLWLMRASSIGWASDLRMPLVHHLVRDLHRPDHGARGIHLVRVHQ